MTQKELFMTQKELFGFQNDCLAQPFQRLNNKLKDKLLFRHLY